MKHRFGIVNVSRPIRGPLLDSPLALCDVRSFTDDDLIASDLVYPHVRGETSSVEFNPGHRRYYFSEQQPDEVILIRVHDSADDGRPRLSFHTSFENSLAPHATCDVRRAGEALADMQVVKEQAIGHSLLISLDC